MYRLKDTCIKRKQAERHIDLKNYSVTNISNKIMEESIDKAEKVYLTDNQIFLKIWTSPRLVFKFINDQQYGEYVTILLIFTGIYNVLNRAMSKNMGDHIPLWGVLCLCILGGAIFGWISNYIWAALISWTGGLLHGEGDTDSILRVMSYAMIPTIVSLIPVSLQIAAYGNDLFKSDINLLNSTWTDGLFLYTTTAISIGLRIWSFVLMVIGISEVQKIPVWKSLLNIILPFLVIGLPIMLIILLFTGFNIGG